VFAHNIRESHFSRRCPLVANSKINVERGKRKLKRVADDWAEDTGKNPDDLEIYGDEEGT
jgi:hypothetical protein